MARFKYLFVLCLLFVVSGCGGYKMALIKGQESIDPAKQSLALLSVRLSNQNKPDRQLKLAGVAIVPKPVAQYSRWDVKVSNTYMAEAPYKSEKDSFNEYLLSFSLENGVNNVMSLITTYESFPIISARALVSLNMETNIKPASVTYLGHINATLRERKNDDEERAAMFPLIDAAVAGYSTGTFDVVVEDKFDEDMKVFVSEYPGLQKANIEKSILPKWVRPENRNSK